MATNTKNGSRKGAVKERSQVYNPTTGHYIKRDSNTGKFIEVKTDGKPFKGVTKETTIIKSNPFVDKKFAKQVEKAVIKLRNKK